ncbi:hypothetical protein B0T26DRAFT_311491 [Lasiosphaeria miniovina]|uniref:Uncharacterized protein n=1 Tax=Lasiosphaeria miniovina TaxID=1954250 RepID=A0AA40ALJ1_9PEZI|nr:uncharacterized protein B0T26DRAFT_311491 [Lasiosphaeria miniovina]KAK0718075.1 hypothetical protein B0T26DRAFT_311491 [Lasiosphaeria miniovina]
MATLTMYTSATASNRIETRVFRMGCRVWNKKLWIDIDLQLTHLSFSVILYFSFVLLFDLTLVGTHCLARLLGVFALFLWLLLLYTYLSDTYLFVWDRGFESAAC